MNQLPEEPPIGQPCLSDLPSEEGFWRLRIYRVDGLKIDPAGEVFVLCQNAN